MHIIFMYSCVLYLDIIASSEVTFSILHMSSETPVLLFLNKTLRSTNSLFEVELIALLSLPHSITMTFSSLVSSSTKNS